MDSEEQHTRFVLTMPGRPAIICRDLSELMHDISEYASYVMPAKGETLTIKLVEMSDSELDELPTSEFDALMRD